MNFQELMYQRIWRRDTEMGRLDQTISKEISLLRIERLIDDLENKRIYPEDLGFVQVQRFMELTDPIRAADPRRRDMGKMKDLDQQLAEVGELINAGLSRLQMARGKGINPDMDMLQQRVGNFNDQLHGGDSFESALGVIRHLRKETYELEEALIQFEVAGDFSPEAHEKVESEVADLFVLSFAAAHYLSVNAFSATMKKMDVNEKRKWGKPDSEGVVEHIREPKPLDFSPEASWQGDIHQTEEGVFQGTEYPSPPNHYSDRHKVTCPTCGVEHLIQANWVTYCPRCIAGKETLTRGID